MLVDIGSCQPNEGASVRESVSDEGQLVVVATPLGNLGDISKRALELLATADLVYCEDTRRSSTLFSANGIAVNGRLRALHEHNEASMCDEIVEHVESRRLIVMISDAGTPGISDPGARVVTAVARAGLKVSTAPGPSAVIAALSISGLNTDRFVMEGFVPRKAGERSLLYDQWERETRTIVFYESPQRLATTLREIALRFAQRGVAVAREITKLHEEVIRGSASQVADLIANREVVGEIVVVLEGCVETLLVDPEVIRSALAAQFTSGASVRDAVDAVEASLCVAHREVYRLALEVKNGDVT